MLRTDHCYPPTVHAPLHPTVADHHFEALTMPAPLPPTIEPLTPSPRRTNIPPLPEVTFTDDEAEWLWRDQQRARAAWGASIVTRTHDDQVALNATRRAALDAKLQPPSRVPWFGLAVGAALFAVGYLMGRWLP